MSKPPAKIVLADAPRSAPEIGSVALREPPEIASNLTIARHIAAWYAATRNIVARWGGTEALAAQLETAMSGVSDRLNRREVKGALQRAFVDHLAIAGTHPDAAEGLLRDLCDLYGYDYPKKKARKTLPEKFAALVRSLSNCGELGRAAIKSAAATLGIDPAEYEP